MTNRSPTIPRGDLLAGIELIVFDKDGTLIEFDLMWGGWVDDIAGRLEASTGLPLRHGLYEMLGVDPATGLVYWHGLMASTPMARIGGAMWGRSLRSAVSRTAVGLAMTMSSASAVS